MRKTPFVCLLLLSAFVIVSCARKAPPIVVDPEIQRIEKAISFVPSAGMTRADVDAILGPPDHTGHTKAGGMLCLYTINGMPAPRIVDADTNTVIGEGFEVRRTVIFDKDGKVVDWYGFERRLVISEEPADEAGEESGT